MSRMRMPPQTNTMKKSVTRPSRAKTKTKMRRQTLARTMRTIKPRLTMTLKASKIWQPTEKAADQYYYSLESKRLTRLIREWKLSRVEESELAKRRE